MTHMVLLGAGWSQLPEPQAVILRSWFYVLVGFLHFWAKTFYWRAMFYHLPLLKACLFIRLSFTLSLHENHVSSLRIPHHIESLLKTDELFLFLLLSFSFKFFGIILLLTPLYVVFSSYSSNDFFRQHGFRSDSFRSSWSHLHSSDLFRQY